MRKHFQLSLVLVILLTYLQNVAFGYDTVTAFSGVTITPSSTPVMPGTPVNISVNASVTNGAPVYYKFYYCGNYGTSDYESTPWTVVSEYSTSGTCTYTFPDAGSYVVVARAVTNPNNEPNALPIIGGIVNVGGNSNNVNFSSFTTTASPTLTMGNSINVSVSAAANSGSPIYYKFYYCGNYGTPLYDSTPWNIVQNYSLSNSSSYQFDNAGNYIAVVRAVTDPANEPAALPIFGCSISVNNMDSACTDSFWYDGSCYPDSKLADWGFGYVEQFYYHNDKNYNWYIDQADTGVYSDNNAGPACATMAAKWSNQSFSKSTEDARNMHHPEGDKWDITDISNYLNHYSISNSTAIAENTQRLVDLINQGYIIILPFNMAYIEKNNSTEQRTGRFYNYDGSHFFIVKGARKVDGQLYFEVYDPKNDHAAYSDASSKGKNRHYKAEEILRGAYYMVVVSPGQ